MRVLTLRPEVASEYPQRSLSVSGRAIIALGLALLTGLTLGQLTLLGGGSFENVPARSTEATRIGLEFYDAIGAYLTTGQTAELQTLVQPEFVDHIDGQPEAKGIEAFLRTMDELRSFVSGEGLIATPMTSSGNLVRFSVSIPPRADAAIV